MPWITSPTPARPDGSADDMLLEAVAARVARRGEGRLLRLGHIAPPDTCGPCRREGAHRGDGRAARRVLAVPRDLVRASRSMLEVEGLAHPRVVGERRAQIAGGLGLARLAALVDGDAGSRRCRGAGASKRPSFFKFTEVGGRHLVHDVDVARAQVGHPHVVVGDDAETRAVEARLPRVEVVGETSLARCGPAARAPRRGPRPHAHRRGRRTSRRACSPQDEGDRHAGPVGERGHQRGEGALQPEPDRRAGSTTSTAVTGSRLRCAGWSPSSRGAGRART